MNDFYKAYDIVAEVKTPIFVGAGDKLSKKDYYVDEKENKIYVIDINKLISINDKILSLYENYALNISKTFNEWVKEDVIRVYLNEELIKNELSIYTIDIGNADIRGGSKQINSNKKEYNTTNIEKFIKNAYNEVYLPGSSIKGAIRTAVISSELLYEKNEKKIDDNFNQLKGVIEEFKDKTKKGFNSKNIEKQYFNKLGRNINKGFDAVNDIFSYISISDSEPIDINSLVLCEKIDIGNDGKEHKLKLIRETIKPNISIKFKINIQNDKNVFQMEDILEKLKIYSNKYLEYYNKNFKLPLANYDGIYLLIGGGVGYISKTIVDKIDVNNGAYYISQILGNIFYKHKHYNDYKKFGFSPRLEKSTKYENKLLPMGLLEIKKVFEPKTGKYILNK